MGRLLLTLITLLLAPKNFLATGKLTLMRTVRTRMFLNDLDLPLFTCFSEQFQQSSTIELVSKDD